MGWFEVNPYSHLDYVNSLSEFGVPLALPESGTWILKRQIPGSTSYDVMGCYPIFACNNWSALKSDLRSMDDQLVSVTVVTDPFGKYDESCLRKSFNSVVRPFKSHYVIDLGKIGTSKISAHHRRNIRKALQYAQIERVLDPCKCIDEWCELYDNLIARHDIQGIPRFSRSAFEKQLMVPGIVVFKATHEEETIGMVLWYCNEQIGYYHLGAYSDLGYELLASYALFSSAIEYFSSDGLEWLSLGAGAGVTSDATDGLSRFKSGWSSTTRFSYLCGRIFDENKYDAITAAKKISKTDYFPAYRAGEYL